MKKSQIMVFGANPAWQKCLVFDSFAANAVNRARSIEAYPAGKGVNFCRAAHCLGGAITTVYQFADGNNGDMLIKALHEEGIQEVSVRSGKPTRSCITCIDESKGQVTEVIEPSFAVGSEFMSEMRVSWCAGILRADAAAITGSLPDGTPPMIYTDIAAAVSENGIPLLVDAAGEGIIPALDVARDFILKVNREELQRMTGASSVEQAMDNAEKRWPHAILAVTDGAGDAYMSIFGKSRYRYKIRNVKVVSPIGCGDTCSAVLLCQILAGMPPQRAFAFALAAACANCLNRKSGFFELAKCHELMPKVEKMP